MTTFYANKPASYIQIKKKNHGRLSIERRVDCYNVFIRKNTDDSYSARLKQSELNELARVLDYWRTDKKNDFIPSDEQIDAWVGKKMNELKRKRQICSK